MDNETRSLSTRPVTPAAEAPTDIPDFLLAPAPCNSGRPVRPGHEQLAARRAEATRILSDAADRLAEVMWDFGCSTEGMEPNQLMEAAAYVMGLEGDGD